MDGIDELIRVRNIGFYSPKNIEKIAAKIKEIDRRISQLDVHILACAIEDISLME